MKKEIFWVNMQYVNLALCLFGQIAIGWFFIPAQIAYLIGDIIAVVRNITLHRPIADHVRDLTFTIITIGIIIIKVFGK